MVVNFPKSYRQSHGFAIFPSLSLTHSLAPQPPPSGDTDKETVYTYPNADPYLEEVKAFLDTVRSGGEGEGGSGTVRSTYRDSLHTYQLSWAIRRASEASTMT